MSDATEIVVRALLMGVGATACMDLWALFLRRALGVRSLDLGLLGRWVGHFARGRFAHESIAAAEPIRGERALGWATHYAIGITFASLLLAAWGLSWARSPTLWPAVVVGMATLAAPLLVMQPCMGMGIAALRTKRPNLARLKSLGTHLVYSFGLYATAVLTAAVLPQC